MSSFLEIEGFSIEEIGKRSDNPKLKKLCIYYYILRYIELYSIRKLKFDVYENNEENDDTFNNISEIIVKSVNGMTKINPKEFNFDKDKLTDDILDITNELSEVAKSIKSLGYSVDRIKEISEKLIKEDDDKMQLGVLSPLELSLFVTTGCIEVFLFARETKRPEMFEYAVNHLRNFPLMFTKNIKMVCRQTISSVVQMYEGSGK